jgi:siroheme synthase-like protein
MSVFQRGPVTVAVSTGGASPALATHLKEKLESLVGWEYGLLAEWMAEQREAVKSTVNPQVERRDIWRAVLASPVLDMLRRGDLHTARELFDKLVSVAMSDDE